MKRKPSSKWLKTYFKTFEVKTKEREKFEANNELISGVYVPETPSQWSPMGHFVANQISLKITFKSWDATRKDETEGRTQWSERSFPTGTVLWSYVNAQLVVLKQELQRSWGHRMVDYLPGWPAMPAWILCRTPFSEQWERSRRWTSFSLKTK